jgi:plastocyanin
MALPSGGAVPSQARAVSAGDTLRLMSTHPFDVTLSATDPRTGATGLGQVISQNDIYGIFSIPDITGNAGNPEVIVKMVDATGIGQDYWVFYNALTDLRYTLAVREVATGRTKTFNDAKIGTTVCGAFDTSGFQSTSSSTPTATPTNPQPTPTPTPPSSTTQVVNVGQGGTNTFRDSVSGNSSTTVRVGDTVQWKFVSTGSYHSTTSGTCSESGDPYYGNNYVTCNPDGNWDSGQQVPPATFSKTFTTPGNYPYYCSVHGSMMTGTITVNP